MIVNAQLIHATPQLNTSPAQKFSSRYTLEMLNVINSLVGPKGASALLRAAGLLENLPPKLNQRHENTIPYVYLANLFRTLDFIYGPRGARSIAYQVGKQSFEPAFGAFDLVAHTRSNQGKLFSTAEKLEAALCALAEISAQSSDQHIVLADHTDHFRFTVGNCPICSVPMNVDLPICYFTVGYLRGGLQSILGMNDFPIQEIECVAKGDPACVFTIRKKRFTTNEIGSGLTGFLSLPEHLREE
jgi:predicted hydrocarbon binding protein